MPHASPIPTRVTGFLQRAISAITPLHRRRRADVRRGSPPEGGAGGVAYPRLGPLAVDGAAAGVERLGPGRSVVLGTESAIAKRVQCVEEGRASVSMCLRGKAGSWRWWWWWLRSETGGVAWSVFMPRRASHCDAGRGREEQGAFSGFGLQMAVG